MNNVVCVMFAWGVFFEKQKFEILNFSLKIFLDYFER